MKRALKIVMALSVLALCSCEMNTDDDNYLPVSTPTENVKKRGGNSEVVDHTNEPTEPTTTEPTTNEPTTDEPTTNEPTVTEPTIDWDKTIAKTDEKLYEKGCAIYNDTFFKDKKAFAHPEIERSTFYPKIEGLEYTTTQIDRPAEDGCNYWYYHYELKQTLENIGRICNYLGISQDIVIVWG